MLKTIQMNPILLKVIGIFLSLLLLLSFNLITASKAYAAPALIPVVGEGLIGVLQLLDLVLVGAVGYELNKDYPFISDYFYNVGTDIADWCAALPQDMYYTDTMGNYYLANGSQVSSISDLLLDASKLPSSYSFPVNFLAEITSNVWVSGEGNCRAFDFNHIVRNNDLWYTPFYFTTSGEPCISAVSLKMGLEKNSWKYVDYRLDPSNIVNDTNSAITLANDKRTYMEFAFNNAPSTISSRYILNQGVITTLVSNQVGGYNGSFFTHPRYVNSDGVTVDGDTTTLFNTAKVANVGWLTSSTVPRFEIDVEGKDLEEVYISPAPDYQPPDNNDDDGGIQLLPPDLWEVFKSVKDFLDNTNNNTTLKDYVNNNYNYNTVDVDVNVPDSFHIIFESSLDVNLNLSGGVNVDITINDKTELPSISEGDGEGFFNANVIDVFAALTKNNPVMAVITGLFSAIDPVLLSIVSVSISLILVLALWKLIKG